MRIGTERDDPLPDGFGWWLSCFMAIIAFEGTGRQRAAGVMECSSDGWAMINGTDKSDIVMCCNVDVSYFS